MAYARYYKTLFLPELNGQYKLWSKYFSKYCSKVDEVVQFGNLIGLSDTMKDRGTGGPNLAVLNYIRLWRNTYSNWHQLIGPNEIVALNYPGEWTNDTTTKIIRDGWLNDERRSFQSAVVNKKRLVTHGGLSYGMWTQLDRPQTAEEAALRINERFNGTLFPGRGLKLSGKPNFTVDPIFADPVHEVYPSWITAPESCPFGQIHTAGGLNTPEGRKMMNEEGALLQSVDKTSHHNFGGIVEINEATFISITPTIPDHVLYSQLGKIWKLYIEKIPVLDTRDELFEASEDREQS